MPEILKLARHCHGVIADFDSIGHFCKVLSSMTTSKYSLTLACLSWTVVLFWATQSFAICAVMYPLGMVLGALLCRRIGDRASTNQWMLVLAIWLVVIGFAVSPSHVPR
jgi:hypothetical protein